MFYKVLKSMRLLECKAFQKTVATLLLALCGVFAFADSEEESLANNSVASVDGFTISMEDFDFAYREEAKRRFYHRRPQDTQLQAFRTEIRDKLIDGVLLVKEAQRQGLALSQSEVDNEVLRLQEGVKTKTGTLQGNEIYWNLVGLRFAREKAEERLREWVDAQVRVSEEAIMNYYNLNLTKFTEPERYRVSVILLSVDPSAAPDVWRKAEQDAGVLVFRLRNGEDFSGIARAQSSDATAANGGDMGYQHTGMLAPAVNEALDEMEINAVTDPIRVLEGYAVFKLTGKMEAKQRLYEEVHERAGQLLLQEAQEQAWNNLLEKLREHAVIVISSP